MSLYVKYQEQKSVPEGIYVARIDGLELIVHEQYGESIKWTFSIQDNRPEINNTTVTCFSSTLVTPKSKLYGWLQAFGIILDVGQQFDIETLLGTVCRVRIKNNTQKKVINGQERDITYSNVNGVAAYKAPAVTSMQPVAMQPVSAPAQPYVASQSQQQQPRAQVVPANQLTEDEEFDF